MLNMADGTLIIQKAICMFLKVIINMLVPWLLGVTDNGMFIN